MYYGIERIFEVYIDDDDPRNEVSSAAYYCERTRTFRNELLVTFLSLVFDGWESRYRDVGLSCGFDLWDFEFLFLTRHSRQGIELVLEKSLNSLL